MQTKSQLDRPFCSLNVSQQHRLDQIFLILYSGVIEIDIRIIKTDIYSIHCFIILKVNDNSALTNAIDSQHNFFVPYIINYGKENHFLIKLHYNINNNNLIYMLLLPFIVKNMIGAKDNYYFS